MNHSFLNRTRIAELRSKGYKIVGFGAGVLGLKTIRYLDNPFEFFIDNSLEKVRSGWKEYTSSKIDVPIIHISDFILQEGDLVAVVICSEHYEVMAKQIDTLYPGMAIFYTPVLKDFETFSRLHNCSEKILISAYGGAGGLYILNGRTGKYQLIHEGSFRGTTQYDDHVLVANEHGDIFRLNENEECFSLLKIYSQKFRVNTHGILYWKELDLLFVTETLNDCLSVYDMPRFKKIDEIPISEKSEVKGGNFHHINDICVSKGKMYWSVISKSGGFYSDVLDGVVFEFDYSNGRKLQPIMEDLLFPHAIMEVNDKLLLLNSFNGDVLNKNNERMINLPGFVRGMDAKDGILYIGQSRHRRLDMAKKYFNGVSMDSGIYVVDLASSMYRFIHMPEMCDIFNIRILD